MVNLQIHFQNQQIISKTTELISLLGCICTFMNLNSEQMVVNNKKTLKLNKSEFQNATALQYMPFCNMCKFDANRLPLMYKVQ